MKRFVAAIALLPLWAAALSQAQQTGTTRKIAMSALEDIRAVAPALEHYAQDRLFGEVWKRPDLSQRDRSIVTLAVMIARNQTTDMPFYLNLALDNGVKPGEISEMITHLAFYSGWGNAVSAVAMAKEVFARRGIKPGELPQASDKLLPLDKAAEEQRAARVEQDFGAVSPGVVKYTGEILFRDLWLRPALAPGIAVW
jgi:4-carboxymuconolactone decarboxylase